MARDEQIDKRSEVIDQNLKKIFQQEVDRDLPDRFTNLIEQLRSKDAADAKSTGGN